MNGRTINQNMNQFQTTSFQNEPPLYLSGPQRVNGYPNGPLITNATVTNDKFSYPVLPQPLPQL